MILAYCLGFCFPIDTMISSYLFTSTSTVCTHCHCTFATDGKVCCVHYHCRCTMAKCVYITIATVQWQSVCTVQWYNDLDQRPPLPLVPCQLLLPLPPLFTIVLPKHSLFIICHSPVNSCHFRVGNSNWL